MNNNHVPSWQNVFKFFKWVKNKHETLDGSSSLLEQETEKQMIKSLKFLYYKNSLLKLTYWCNDKYANFNKTINVLHVPVWISLVLGPEHREEQAKEDGHKS